MPNKKTKCDNANSSGTEQCNRPRNHVVKDATSQYQFPYKQFGQMKTICVNQTPEEDTWPGGALWDIGVLLAKVLVMVNNPPPTTEKKGGGKNNCNKKERELYVSRIRTQGLWPKEWKDCTILELGAGVGLTGLVGASLGAKVSLITDLDIVVEKVTAPNVDLNKKAFGIGQTVIAIPLAWGNEHDEEVCRQLLINNTKQSKTSTSKRKTKKGKKVVARDCSSEDDHVTTDPDLILIGDVAYQHKPGAPSHFDILLSTLLKFASTPKTTVVFGTRMRMPASADLLEMFREHFDEVIQPPVEAQELDTAFKEKTLGRKSLITIHFFKRKKMQFEP